ncbi:MAG: response regulator [Candidatus Omnitrophica bacterium]|nr:response regulator [Candidatus Omnitrophota bacterium]
MIEIDPRYRSYQLVVLDDDYVVRESLALCLKEFGYSVLTYSSAQELLDCLDSIRCDLILCDLSMPEINGLDFLEKANPRKRGIPVILITAYGSFDIACKALRLGARALFSKPYDLKEIKKSIRYLIAESIVEKKKAKLSEQVNQQIEFFKHQVEDTNEKYRQLVYSSLEALMNSLEIKDEYTKDHSKRVSQYSGMFGQYLKLDDTEIYNLKLAGIFHDIGKIGISESILKKKDKLTAEEYEVIKTHPLISEYILQPLNVFSSVLEIIRSHHERFDGLGYPSGVVGEDIPFGARVMSIVDAYDAMSTVRPYRGSYGLKTIIDELERVKGTQFDARLVDEFIRFLESGELTNLYVS